MKSFADWTTDIAAANKKPKPSVDPDYLPDGLTYMGRGEYKATCCICGEFKEVVGWEPGVPFDVDTFHCGGSQRCCP